MEIARHDNWRVRGWFRLPSFPPDAKIAIGAPRLMPALVSVRLVCDLEQEIPRQWG
jgi:hypothetical protein